MSYEYDLYLKQHRDHVKDAWHFLKTNRIGAEYFESKGYFVGLIDDLVEHHDQSKDFVDEYLAYDKKFYDFPKVLKSEEEIKRDFDNAWLSHIHRNPHHWQYWLLYNPDGSVSALPMKIPYIFEMICDWWAFSLAKDDQYEIFSWYLANKDTIKLAPETEEIVIDILDELKLFLDSHK